MPAHRPQTTVPNRPTFSASTASHRQPLQTQPSSFIKTDPESTACRNPVFKTPLKKVFRPPWADSGSKPNTSQTNISNSFIEDREDEDDRPLSEILRQEPAFSNFI